MPWGVALHAQPSTALPSHTGVPLFVPQGGIQQATTLHPEISPVERPHTHNQRHGRPITQMGVKGHGVRPLGANNLDATPCEPWWSIPSALLIQPHNQGDEGRPQGSNSHVGRPEIRGVGHTCTSAHARVGAFLPCWVALVFRRSKTTRTKVWITLLHHSYHPPTIAR